MSQVRLTQTRARRVAFAEAYEVAEWADRVEVTRSTSSTSG